VRLEVWNTPVQPGRDAGTGAAANASWPSLVGIAWDADPRLALALRQRFPGAGLDAALAPLIVSNAHDPVLQVGKHAPHHGHPTSPVQLTSRKGGRCTASFHWSGLLPHPERRPMTAHVTAKRSLQLLCALQLQRDLSQAIRKQCRDFTRQ